MTPSNLEILKDFIRESIEAFVLILVIFMISDKAVDTESLLRITKISLVLGVVNVGLALFDVESHAKVKDGMKSSLGNTMLASVTGMGAGIRR
jgi:glycerol uptake facilitator-like aquaporin